MKSKSFSKFSVSLFMSLVTLCSACGDTTASTPKEEKIFQALDNSQMERFKSEELVLVDGAVNVEWTSSNPSVAVVEDGKIVAVSAGEAKITAKSGNATQSQTIVVMEATQQIEVHAESFSVLYGDSYEVDMIAYYDNQPLEGVTYACVSANSSICEVKELALKGVACGETTVTLSVIWRGSVIAEKQIPCKVNRNAAIYTDKESYLLYTKPTVLDASFAVSHDIEEKVYLDDVVRSDVSVVWESSDESVVTVDENGVLCSVEEGLAYVVGTCTVDGVELSTREIPIEVKKPYYSTKMDVLFESKDEIAHLDADTLLGEGEKIQTVVNLSDGKEYSVQDGNLPLSAFGLGEYRWALYAEDEAFATEITARITNYVVRTAEDLSKLSNPENLGVYAVLANDLIDVGSYKPKNRNSAHNFVGVLDGAGHVISGIALAEQNAGIFGYFSGTVKNLAVIGRTAAYGNQGAFYYMALGNPVFENVYVDLTLSNGYGFKGNGVLGGGLNVNSITIDNSIIIARTSDGNSLDTTFGIVSGRVITYNFNFTNTYFIGKGTLFGLGSGADNRNNHLHNTKTQTWYETEADFIADKQAGKLNFDGFSYYWNLASDIPAFK